MPGPLKDAGLILGHKISFSGKLEVPALLRGQAVRSTDKHGFFGQVTDADLGGGGAEREAARWECSGVVP